MLTMNRRSFLKVTAGAAATAAFLPQGLAAAPKRNLRNAIMYSTIGMKGIVLEKFRAMKEAGFEGVEPLGGMDRDEVLAAFQATGLRAARLAGAFRPDFLLGGDAFFLRVAIGSSSLRVLLTENVQRVWR